MFKLSNAILHDSCKAQQELKHHRGLNNSASKQLVHQCLSYILHLTASLTKVDPETSLFQVVNIIIIIMAWNRSVAPAKITWIASLRKIYFREPHHVIFPLQSLPSKCWAEVREPVTKKFAPPKNVLWSPVLPATFLCEDNGSAPLLEEQTFTSVALLWRRQIQKWATVAILAPFSTRITPVITSGLVALFRI